MPFQGKERVKANLRANAGQFARALALEAHARLVRKTPVDTGRARANWNAALGGPDRSVRPVRADRGGKGTDGAAIRAAQQEAQTQIARFGPGQVLYIVNSLPYIPMLEDGSSKQAPQGMVKTTVAELKPLASRIAAKVAAGGQ